MEMTISFPAKAVTEDGLWSAGPPEAALVERARRGQLPAFEALYRMHVGRIYALCLRITSHAGDAEEATQECFIRAWRGLGRFRGEAAFSSWLHRIALRVVFERFRTGRLERSLSRESTLEEIESVAQPPVPDELALDLECAIHNLPPMARLVFVLHDVEGYEHPEIASLLHLAVGTSKAHLHRARRLLQDHLGP
jgi:RNA polymerase sigma-70 factor (ECF subfamily)